MFVQEFCEAECRVVLFCVEGEPGSASMCAVTPGLPVGAIGAPVGGPRAPPEAGCESGAPVFGADIRKGLSDFQRGTHNHTRTHVHHHIPFGTLHESRFVIRVMRAWSTPPARSGLGTERTSAPHPLRDVTRVPLRHPVMRAWSRSSDTSRQGSSSEESLSHKCVTKASIKRHPEALTLDPVVSQTGSHVYYVTLYAGCQGAGERALVRLSRAPSVSKQHGTRAPAC